MNLPLVFDIATGLIFIYLTLSLLTSEIQEIIATLLQWRADHLKKSIEILLTGDISQDPNLVRFADELYQSPLIRSLNQEAKGPIARLFREIFQKVIDLYRFVTGTRNTFGNQRSGPSYIPGDAFAAALVQKLDLESVTQMVSEVTLRRFSQEKIALVQSIIDALRNSVGDDLLLENELILLKRHLSDIYDDLINRRTTLASSIDQATTQIIQFIDNTSAALASNDYCEDIIRQRLPYVRQAIFLKKLEPTISEVLSLVVDQRQNLSPALVDIAAKLNRTSAILPQQLKQNLLSLSRQAQLKAEGLESGIRQLEQEIQDWFNNSMERASGVYKRNAKGIAILIGFLIAIITNTDTFHIVNRLSNDTLLRSTISQAADQVVIRTVQSGGVPQTAAPAAPAPAIAPAAPAPPDPNAGSVAAPAPAVTLQQDLETVKTAVDNVLVGIPLPIGWNSVNLQQQTVEDMGWAVPYLRRVIGWFVSGVALSMGASFWFDLLGKIVRVRGSGNPPRPTSHDE